MLCTAACCAHQLCWTSLLRATLPHLSTPVRLVSFLKHPYLVIIPLSDLGSLHREEEQEVGYIPCSLWGFGLVLEGQSSVKLVTLWASLSSFFLRWNLEIPGGVCFCSVRILRVWISATLSIFQNAVCNKRHLKNFTVTPAVFSEFQIS